jgi:tRNA (adenine22-N1)-methyltransferase
MLEARLQAVADQIKAHVHADIGSDHALLLKYLLTSGRVHRAIAIEKNQQPFENALGALQGLNAEVRLGDGLACLVPGEAHSLSLTGMGAKLIAKILCGQLKTEGTPRHSNSGLPAHLVLQPNDNPIPLRQWAAQNSFHITHEQMVEGFWRYTVLTLSCRTGPDLAYEGLPKTAALEYGPVLLAQRHPLLYQELLAQQKYWQKLISQSPLAAKRLETINQALELY